MELLKQVFWQERQNRIFVSFDSVGAVAIVWMCLVFMQHPSWNWMVWHNWSFFWFHISSSKIVTHDLGNCRFLKPVGSDPNFVSQYTGHSVDLNNFHNHRNPVSRAWKSTLFRYPSSCSFCGCRRTTAEKLEAKLVLFIFLMVQRSVQEVSHVDSKTWPLRRKAHQLINNQILNYTQITLSFT